MSGILTNPEMNGKIVAMLRLHDNAAVLYAAARIKELEQKLDVVEYASLAQRIAIEDLEQQLQAEQQKRQDAHDAAEVAMAAASRCDALNAELIEQRDAERRFAKKAEVVLQDAVRKLQAERQEHQSDAHTVHALRRELRETKADLTAMDADRQDDRLSNPHFGTSPRYLVEVQRDRLKSECEGLRQQLAASIEVANIYAPYRESSFEYAKAARIARQQLHAECRIAEKAEALLADAMDELQACRLRCEKTETVLRQQLQEAEKMLAIAMGALKHCETADPELTGDVLDVIEKRLTPEALARICEYERQGEEERCRL